MYCRLAAKEGVAVYFDLSTSSKHEHISSRHAADMNILVLCK